MAIDQYIYVIFNTTREVFPPDEFFEVVDWCFANCSGRFLYNHVYEGRQKQYWGFQFENKEDESMFILRWV